MKTTHFNLLLIGILAAVGAIGYLSFSTINYGSTAVDQPATTVPDTTTPVATETPTDGSVVATDDATVTTPTTAPATATATTPATTTTGTVPAKYTALAAKIQALLDDNVQMKEGSKGTRVETVQEFLNVYDSGNIVKPNGVYGPTTKSRTVKFQTEMGLPKSGFAGPKTYSKMLEWLKTSAQ